MLFMQMIKEEQDLIVSVTSLSLIPYKDLTPKPFKLPPLKHNTAYVRPPVTDQTFVPEKY